MGEPYYENLGGIESIENIILQSGKNLPDIKMDYIDPIKDALCYVGLKVVVFIYKMFHRSLTMLLTITKQFIPDNVSICDSLASSCKTFCVTFDQLYAENKTGNLSKMLANYRVISRFDDFKVYLFSEECWKCSFYKRTYAAGIFVPCLLDNKKMNYEITKNSESGMIDVVRTDHPKIEEKYYNFNDKRFPNTKSDVLEILVNAPIEL